MPAKNLIKTFVPGSFYHVYNRGVAKQDIFRDKRDYVVFLRFLKEYLLPSGHPSLKVLQKLNPRRNPVNCSEDVELHVYCLMPNHFHFLIRLTTKNGLTKFMRALATNYSMYFNNKYDRVGPLYQGTYKAVLVKSDEQFLHLSRYIHKNPVHITEIAKTEALQEYSFSSYRNYLGLRKQDWIQTDFLLKYFGDNQHDLKYRAFVEEKELNQTLIKDVVIEDWNK